MTKGRAIICDIDGTLAIRGDHDIYDYASVHLDTVREAVYRLLLRYHTVNERCGEASGLATRIVLLTGRMDDSRSHTEAWLGANAVPYHELHMRAAGDYRKDSVVKREIYEREIAPRFDVEVVIDDRDQVVAMWRRELGLPCFQVEYGDF